MVPFDRLVRIVDLWAAKGRNEDIFAQIGTSQYRPKHMKYVDFLGDLEFKECMKKAKAVVSHAGTGTIIASLVLKKPILVMPRRVVLKETRTDHQYATATKFLELGYINAALDENELYAKLDELSDKDVRPWHVIGDRASPMLIEAIRKFIS